MVRLQSQSQRASNAELPARGKDERVQTGLGPLPGCEDLKLCASYRAPNSSSAETNITKLSFPPKYVFDLALEVCIVFLFYPAFPVVLPRSDEDLLGISTHGAIEILFVIYFKALGKGRHGSATACRRRAGFYHGERRCVESRDRDAPAGGITARIGRGEERATSTPPGEHVAAQRECARIPRRPWACFLLSAIPSGLRHLLRRDRALGLGFGW